MKPGYYIDIFDDLVVVYADGTYELYDIKSIKDDGRVNWGFVKRNDKNARLFAEMFIGEL